MLALPGVSSVVLPKDRERVEGNIARRLHGEIESLHYFFSGLRADGSVIELEAFGTRSVVNGQSAIIGTILDITARRQAEAQLLIQSAALEAAANGIVITDAMGKILWVNRSFVRMTGFAEAEAVGNKTSLLKSGRQDEGFYNEMWTTVRRGEVWQGELWNRRKDGRVYQEEMTITPVPDRDGRISHFVAIKQDISARKEAEATLRESEMRFREMAENIGEVFWMVNPGSTQMLYISPAYEKIWGRSCQSIYADPDNWITAIHAEDRPRVLAAYERFQVSGEYNESYRIVRPDGATRWIRDRGFPVRDESGTVRRLVGIAEDITETHKLEEQFRQAQKLEAIGTLAGGIAHDFNNILAAIIGFTELARMRVKDNPVVSEYLASVMQGSERAVALVRQILAFSRGQVLMNLAVNARDAMPEGGWLAVDAEAVELPPPDARAAPGARAGWFACLRVADSGSGIPPEILAQIFDPFFTTKEVGKGTGLGLATVYGIVQQHEGWITVGSEVGRGTTFRIYLPLLAQPAVAAPAQPRAAVADSFGHETILLVEDEEVVRTLVRTALEMQGYRIIGAANGEEALEAWRREGPAIQLLLTDMVMPGGMSGRDLARRLLQERPELPVIYMSGYSPNQAEAGFPLQEGVNFIAKPFELARLDQTVRRRLDAR